MSRPLRPATSPSFGGRTPARLLSIIVVFSLGLTLMLPTPAAAQGLSSDIAGLVTDPFGTPVADATVSAKRHVSGDLWQLHETQTDAEGAYTLSGLSSGTWNLSVSKDGHATYAADLKTSGGRDVTHNVTLPALQVRAYTATVLDAESEAPIEGALVTVTGRDSADESQRVATTDANGTATVQLFDQSNEIRITRSGYETYHDYAYHPTRDIERTLTLWSVPEQTATVVGKVVDQNGDPVQAQVNLRPQYDNEPKPVPLDQAPASAEPSPDEDAIRPGRGHDRHNSTTTAADGTFTMHTYEGSLVLNANRRGYLVTEQSLHLAAGETKQVTLTLEALPAKTVTLSGTVTDADSGQPVPGAQINVQVPEMADHAWAQADDDGTWTLQVRPGYTIVEVSRYHWYGGPVHAVAEPAVAEDDTRTSDGGNSSGSSGAGSDAAAPDAPSSSSIMREPASDAQRYLPRVSTFVTTDAASRTIDVALEKRPEAKTIVTGYVVDSDTDTAVAGAQVNFQNHETGEWGNAQTDEHGSYKFVLYGGWHTVRVWADGYLPMAMNLDAPEEGTLRQDLDVQPGHPVQEGWYDPARRDDCCSTMDETYDGGRTGAPTMAEAGSRSGEDSASARAAADDDGARTLQGSGGGLGPYDPSAKDAEAAESPLPWAVVVVAALGALAVIAGLHRRDRS